MYIKSNSQRGDTIVEVLISIAIIAVMLTSAYVLANRSLRTSIGANERAEAIALSQGQVELLKYEARTQNTTNFASLYKNLVGFCLNENSGVVTKTSLSSGAYCENYLGPNTQYAVRVEYLSATLDVFKISVQWDALNSGSRNSMEMFYRVAN